ncbi:Vmc-like lipoprotein signal peptide domain-containing protein [Mycoplasmopsis columbina]|uniref:Vmc-like lipoprotein signal peptide domain-containing protein n=1 Tax=Mycoplasmopsis columbina TaxID=114881 RepID=UPI0004A71EB5|nr:hypothetical protein [Mycoplasmopsis columbina]VEU76909.1 Uncharacterised protein [Mycoplasmopsis columbina]
MKIKKILTTTSIITLPSIALIASSCNNNKNGITFSQVKKEINDAINAKAFSLTTNQNDLQNELTQIQALAQENQLRYRGEIIEDQLNQIPSDPATQDKFTADYLIARKLLIFKFDDEKLNDKYEYVYKSTLDINNQPYLIIDIYHKEINRYAVTGIEIPVQNVINYGSQHTHFSYTAEVAKGLSIVQAYQFNLDQKAQYHYQKPSTNN